MDLPLIERGMSDSQRYPLNLCPDNDEVDILICISEPWELEHGKVVMQF